MFNLDKKYGFVRTEAGDKFFIHLHQYCDVIPNKGDRENPRLDRAVPETMPKEGMEVLFWVTRVTSKEGKSPSVESWTYASVWNRARDSVKV